MITDLQVSTLITLLTKSLKENEGLKVHLYTMMENDKKLFNEMQAIKKLLLEKSDT